MMTDSFSRMADLTIGWPTRRAISTKKAWNMSSTWKEAARTRPRSPLSA